MTTVDYLPKQKNSGAKEASKNRKKQDQVQTRIKKPRVTKPKGSEQKVVQSTKTKKAGQCYVSEHFEVAADRRSDLEPSGTGTPQCMPALKRRDRWTPPVDTLLFEYANPVNEQKCNEPSQDSRPSEGSLATFKFEGAATKRRRVEVHSLPTYSGSKGCSTSIKPKQKAPKKKARTITEQSTAPYALEAPTGPLLQLLTTQAIAKGQRISSTSAALSRKAVGKPSMKSKQLNRQDATSQPPLLSPRSAMKQIEEQCLIFGTSSQLARDSSPIPVVDLQRPVGTLDASGEHVAGASCKTSWSGALLKVDTMPTRLVAGKNLWSAAAQEVPDSLQELHLDGCNDINPNARPARGRTDTANAETTTRTAGPAEPSVSIQLRTGRLVSGLTSAEETEPCLATEIKTNVAKRNPSNPDQTHGTIQINSQVTKPDFDGYQTSQLASELASFGFKALKNRKRMIALLEQCWEGKQRVALKSLQANSHIPQVVSVTTTSKRRNTGNTQETLSKHTSSEVNTQSSDQLWVTAKAADRQARKRASCKDGPKSLVKSPANDKPSVQSRQVASPKRKRRVVLEEITDSDISCHPSPQPSKSRPLETRKRASAARSRNADHDFACSATTKTTSTEDSGPQLQLFADISKAVRSQPWSVTPSLLNWHEKILLYDPIVLEDLASWLNQQGLGAIGIDYEVGPADVKAWCRKQGICCLWKENLRGGMRKRY